MSDETNAAIGIATLAHMEKLVASAIEKHNLERQPIIDDLNARISALESKCVSGFPNGDPDAHRRVHEKYIQEAEERRAMWKGAKTNAIQLGFWATLVFIVTALWDSVKNHLK